MSCTERLGSEVAELIRNLPASDEPFPVDSALLEYLRSSTRTLAAAFPGQFHDNGFYKSTVWQSRAGEETLRIHFWPSSAETGAESNIHGHAWDFQSVVLAGSLCQTIFERERYGQHVAEFAYKSGGQSILRFRGKAELRVASEVQIKEGNSYFLSHTSLHRIERISSTGTITVVLTSNRDKDANVAVFKIKDKRQPSNSDDVANIREQLIELL